MWDFPGDRTGGNRYLVLGPVTWLGIAALIQAPDPDAARAVLTLDR